jgi:predicted regulator of Ras-like GTPase activity (Roadblock/LC7/MglB family)
MATVTLFYVVTEKGTCIYSKSSDSKTDKDLLSGLMTAMESFTKKLFTGELESVSIGSSKYFIIADHGLLFITRTEMNLKDNAARKELEELRNIFFEKFPPDQYSKKWDEMENISGALDPSYDRFFKESDQKMREAIW